MANDDVARAAARGEVACVLIASEWPIYGRFGYGPGDLAGRLDGPPPCRPLQVEPFGRVEIVDALAARKVLPALYDEYAARQPGEIARADHRWDVDLGLDGDPGAAELARPDRDPPR